MAIPPAYEGVWICADPLGHLQYTGHDARGRKQYRYHERWRLARDQRKFSRVRRLGSRLPSIRRRLLQDLKLPNGSRSKAIAMALLLLDLTGLRIGSRSYLHENGTYGLTTLRKKHLRISGDRVQLDFRSKGGAPARVETRNAVLARLLRHAAHGATALFHYRAADGEHSIDAVAVNQRLRELANESVSAKDFRTWTANVRLLQLLRRKKPASTRRRALNEAIAEVAKELGNTPSVCRNSYIDPALVAVFEAGDLDGLQPSPHKGLRIDERRYLGIVSGRTSP